MSLYVYNRSEETGQLLVGVDRLWQLILLFHNIIILEPDQVHYLDIDIISNYSFNISWHPPISLKGIIINYHLILRNLTKNHSGLLMNELILDSYDHHYLVEDLSKSLYTCTNNNAHYIFHVDYFAEPFIPYQIEIAASTKIGKGDIVIKTVFTVESGIIIIIIEDCMILKQL